MACIGVGVMEIHHGNPENFEGGNIETGTL
jgi:hypothetical protein